MKPSPIVFHVGQTVRATGTITRVDNRCVVHAGDTAKVIQVWRSTPDAPQIIAIELPTGDRMIDIVCFDNVPLRPCD